MPEPNPIQSTEAALPYSLDYPPPDFIDPVVEVYKRDVDRSIIRENLKLTVEERLRKAQARAAERAVSLARQTELEQFTDFTNRRLEATTEPPSLEEYLRLWRSYQEKQATIAGIEKSQIEDDAGLSQPLTEAFKHVRSHLGIES